MIFIAIIAVIGIAAVGGILVDAPGRKEVLEQTISNIQFDDLRDGTFIGEFKGEKSHLRDAKVEVTVLEGEIQEIKVLKGALGKDGKPAELRGGRSISDLYNDVMRSKTLQVDVISGATITSKAHLKALENALEQAK